MADDLEKQMRERAEAMLLARQKETAKARVLARRTKMSAAEKLKRKKAAKRRKAALVARRKNNPEFLERQKKIKRPSGGLNRAPGGYSLLERLLARTDPEKWYTHAQLLRLLPEANKNSLHAILYQKARRLGLVERRALVKDHVRPWEDGATGFERSMAMHQPRYVYRIGAESDKDRARAREKESAYTGTRPE